MVQVYKLFILLLMIIPFTYAQDYSGGGLTIQIYPTYSSHIGGDGLDAIFSMGDDLLYIIIDDFNLSSTSQISQGGWYGKSTFRFVNYSEPFDDYVKVIQSGVNTYSFYSTIDLLNDNDLVYLYYMVNCGQYERSQMQLFNGEWKTDLIGIPLDSTLHYTVVAYRSNQVIISHNPAKIIVWDLPKLSEHTDKIAQNDLINIILMIIIILISSLIYYKKPKHLNIR